MSSLVLRKVCRGTGIVNWTLGSLIRDVGTSRMQEKRELFLDLRSSGRWQKIGLRWKIKGKNAFGTNYMYKGLSDIEVEIPVIHVEGPIHQELGVLIYSAKELSWRYSGEALSTYLRSQGI